MTGPAVGAIPERGLRVPAGTPAATGVGLEVGGSLFSGRYRLSRSRTLPVIRATAASPLSPCDQSVVPAVNTVPPRV